MKKLFLALFLISALSISSCKESSDQKVGKQADEENKQADTLDSLTVYQTENLIIIKLSNHIYQHISYLTTEDFGKVPCNGMLVVNDNKGVVFDTPTDNTSSSELINFVTKKLKCEITAIIPTHFHKDCVGGLEEFEKHNIPTFVSDLTLDLLEKNGHKFSKPIQEFDNSLTLNIGNKKVYAQYFGEGHTKDNIIGYFPADKAIFGGCLIKEVGAGKGNLEDANTKDWAETVHKIKAKFPEAIIVIPGHGKSGGTELFDYTIELFEK